MISQSRPCRVKGVRVKIVHVFFPKFYTQVRVSLKASEEYDMVTRQSSKVCLCAGRTATVLFRVKPKTLGRINLKVSAQTLTTNICSSSDSFNGDIEFSDIVVRKLLVEAEGNHYLYAYMLLFWKCCMKMIKQIYFFRGDQRAKTCKRGFRVIKG